MKSRILICLAVFGLAPWCGATAAETPNGQLTLNIQAQPMEDALNQFAQQSGLQVLISSEDAPGAVQSPSLVGSFTADAALKQLLADSGLRYEFVNARTVAIRPMKREEGSSKPAASATSGDGMVRLAQAETSAEGSEQPQSTGDSAEDSQGSKLEEIVVTAQKRVERLQDVPVPVTAISADLLVQSNQTRIQDYYAKVPGLSLTMLGSTDNPVPVIRGLTTGGYTIPTVGTVIDDIPFGGSTIAGGGFAMPDVDPNELARVEVLRGPQGALYGASSLVPRHSDFDRLGRSTEDG